MRAIDVGGLGQNLTVLSSPTTNAINARPLGGRSARGEMDTKIIELRMAVRALPTSNRLVNLAVKSEVLRLSGLLNSQYAAQRGISPVRRLLSSLKNILSRLLALATRK